MVKRRTTDKNDQPRGKGRGASHAPQRDTPIGDHGADGSATKGTAQRHRARPLRVERRLTEESLARFNETRQRIIGDRRFAVSSGDILREVREGQSSHLLGDPRHLSEQHRS